MTSLLEGLKDCLVPKARSGLLHCARREPRHSTAGQLLEKSCSGEIQKHRRPWIHALAPTMARSMAAHIFLRSLVPANAEQMASRLARICGVQVATGPALGPRRSALTSCLCTRLHQGCRLQIELLREKKGKLQGQATSSASFRVCLVACHCRACQVLQVSKMTSAVIAQGSDPLNPKTLKP